MNNKNSIIILKITIICGKKNIIIIKYKKKK